MPREGEAIVGAIVGAVVTVVGRQEMPASHQTRRYRPNCVLACLGTPTKSIASELSVAPLTKTSFFDFWFIIL